MTSDLDIWRSANLLMKRHGKDAPIQAAMRSTMPQFVMEARALAVAVFYS
jgi:hypothetical protein